MFVCVVHLSFTAATAKKKVKKKTSGEGATTATKLKTKTSTKKPSSKDTTVKAKGPAKSVKEPLPEGASPVALVHV